MIERIEKITLQNDRWDGIVLPHAIIRRRAGPNVHYFRVIGFQGKHYICKEIDVSVFRKFIDNAIESFFKLFKRRDTMGAKKPAIKKPMPKKAK